MPSSVYQTIPTHILLQESGWAYGDSGAGEMPPPAQGFPIGGGGGMIPPINAPIPQPPKTVPSYCQSVYKNCQMFPMDPCCSGGVVGPAIPPSSPTVCQMVKVNCELYPDHECCGGGGIPMMYGEPDLSGIPTMQMFMEGKAGDILWGEAGRLLAERTRCYPLNERLMDIFEEYGHFGSACMARVNRNLPECMKRNAEAADRRAQRIANDQVCKKIVGPYGPYGDDMVTGTDPTLDEPSVDDREIMDLLYCSDGTKRSARQGCPAGARAITRAAWEASFVYGYGNDTLHGVDPIRGPQGPVRGGGTGPILGGGEVYLGEVVDGDLYIRNMQISQGSPSCPPCERQTGGPHYGGPNYYPNYGPSVVYGKGGPYQHAGGDRVIGSGPSTGSTLEFPQYGGGGPMNYEDMYEQGGVVGPRGSPTPSWEDRIGGGTYQQGDAAGAPYSGPTRGGAGGLAGGIGGGGRATLLCGKNDDEKQRLNRLMQKSGFIYGLSDTRVGLSMVPDHPQDTAVAYLVNGNYLTRDEVWAAATSALGMDNIGFGQLSDKDLPRLEDLKQELLGYNAMPIYIVEKRNNRCAQQGSTVPAGPPPPPFPLPPIPPDEDGGGGGGDEGSIDGLSPDDEDNENLDEQ